MRRVSLQRRHEAGGAHPRGQHAAHAAGVRDGNGVMFASHSGDICPSGFLELRLGTVRRENVVDVYRNPRLFLELRQPDRFSGRCGGCTSGLRRLARAYAATGDPFAEDPLCTYRPSATTSP
jgi:MoaA/NifB/PqqE/SkfB family radical SAM enzyme